MKYKIMAIFFGLLASWLSTAAAAQTYNFTVPINISNLPEKVRYFRVECTLLLADNSIVGNNFADPSVNPGTGQPMESQVQISVPWNSSLGGPPTHYKCSLYFPDPGSTRGWGSPSTNPDADVQPAPGTPLVEVVSGNL